MSRPYPLRLHACTWPGHMDSWPVSGAGGRLIPAWGGADATQDLSECVLSSRFATRMRMGFPGVPPFPAQAHHAEAGPIPKP